jgi:uncharacterized RDD family membrane protein YckC
MSEYRSSTTYQLADVGQRFLALLIDGVISGVIVGIFTAVFRPGVGSLIGALLGIAYQWYFLTKQNGQTPGKSIMGIRVIKTDGSPLRDADAIVRAVVGNWISGIFFGLGYLWALWDPNRQTWHDKIANTYVIVADKEKRKVIV